MKDFILGTIYVIGFIFIAGSVGANEYGDITIAQLIVRSALAFVVMFIVTCVLNDDIRNSFKEVIADKWRKKKHSRTR